MDAAALERVHDAFQEFQAYFAKQPRELSRHYLQGLVQSGERRNAENLAARRRPGRCSVFESHDDRVIGRLQEYLGGWSTRKRLDGSDFPKQGGKSAGVARQYCGSLGKKLPGWGVSGPCGAQGTGIGGQAAVPCRRNGPGDVERCVAAGVPEARREYRGKTDLALEMLEQAQARGHLESCRPRCGRI